MTQDLTFMISFQFVNLVSVQYIYEKKIQKMYILLSFIMYI